MSSQFSLEINRNGLHDSTPVPVRDRVQRRRLHSLQSSNARGSNSGKLNRGDDTLVLLLLLQSNYMKILQIRQ